MSSANPTRAPEFALNTASLLGRRPLLVKTFRRHLLTKTRFSLGKSGFWKNGAGEETRTLDVHLGKVVLYQLSYARERGAKRYGDPVIVNCFFEIGWDGANVLGVRDIQLRPLREFPVERASADAHEFGGLCAITTRLDQGFA